MKIQLNTDKNIDGTEGLARIIDSKVEDGLRRFADQITRIEVHLSDESGPKTGGDDKRCLLEARLTGRQPMAVTHHAPSVELAVDGAIEKLVHAIATALGKLER